MKSLDQEQRLGSKAFVLIFLRKIAPAFAILIVAYTIIIFGSYLEQGLNTSIFLGISPESTYFSASKMIEWLVSGLFVLAFILFIIGYVVAQLTYINYTITIEEFNLKLKRGIFNLEAVSIPFRQMQDINIVRSIMYRFFGLSRIIIDSAGHEEIDERNETNIILDPIDRELGEQIFRCLQRKIGVQVVETDTKADREAALHKAL
ncbi:MAG: PH domain-containing protein [Candidatus Paceibacterota bacterium]